MSLNHRKLASKDPRATLQFMRLISRYLRRYMRDTSRRREVAQSAFAEMFGKLRQGPTPATKQVPRWTVSCAVNALRRELRRLHRQAIAYESELHSQPEPDLAELAEVREKIERIEELLEKCKDRDREVLLSKIRGDTNAEIAASLETTPATVRTSLHRTRRRLRLALTADEALECARKLVSDMKHAESSSLRPLRGTSR
jgi:RNA polymerase sigma factor (sigma-70 family)